MKTFFFYALAPWLIIAAVHRLRRWMCRPDLDHRIFLKSNPKYSRAQVMKPLAYKHPDLKAEREVAQCLYPEQEQ